MQVTTNKRLINTRTRLGSLANVVAIVLLIGGLLINLQGQGVEYMWVTYAMLIGAVVLQMVAKASTMRFGARPRIDEALNHNLKTLDHKHHLYHYVPGVPVDHLLVSPNGLFVIEARPNLGKFRVVGEKWRREGGLSRWLLAFGEGGVGNMPRELKSRVGATRTFLNEQLGEDLSSTIPVEGIVVFTHPSTKIETENPTVTVVHARDLRPEVKRREGRARLSQDALRRVNQALNEQAAADSLVPAKA